MNQDLIKTHLEDGVLTLTFNRPEAMNAMNQAFMNRLCEELRFAARDPEARVVVITGEGRAFSAGGDIKNLGQPDPQDPLALKYGDDPRWNALEMRHQRMLEAAQGYDLLRTMPKPTIAMVNGPAIGVGMVPALACDFRVCSENSHFNTGYLNIALSGDMGIALQLINAVGPAKARELLFFPRKVDAQEALRIGLASKVVPHEKLAEETRAMARELAQGPTLIYGHLKENIAAAMELDTRTALDIEARNFVRCFETDDQKEAVLAFKEKRTPRFRGS